MYTNMSAAKDKKKQYCRTHNVRVCLYIADIACGSASLYIKTMYFFFCTLVLSAAATVANIKIRYDAKTLQFAMFGTSVICVFYSYTKQNLCGHYEVIGRGLGGGNLLSCVLHRLHACLFPANTQRSILSGI